MVSLTDEQEETERRDMRVQFRKKEEERRIIVSAEADTEREEDNCMQAKQACHYKERCRSHF